MSCSLPASLDTVRVGDGILLNSPEKDILKEEERRTYSHGVAVRNNLENGITAEF